MCFGFLRQFLGRFHAVDAEYEPYRAQLHEAGLSERQLRNMTADERVAALEKARLDPYDYIYLAC